MMNVIKKLLAIFLAVPAAMMVLTSNAHAQAATIVISNCEDLQNMNKNLSGQYILVFDIDCTGINFIPIGPLSPPADASFTGTFDGQNHTIKGIRTSFIGGGGTGLFGSLSGSAIVKNVVVLNPQINGRLAGGLAGAMSGNVTIENVTVKDGVVDGYNNGVGGGLIGSANGGTITKTAAVNVRASGGNGGGLLGSATNVVIKESFATGTATGDVIGGLVGRLNGGQIVDSFSGVDTIDVPTDFNRAITRGGLVGDILAPSTQNVPLIVNSYARGQVRPDPMFGRGGIGAAFLSSIPNVAQPTSTYWDLGASGITTDQFSTTVGKLTTQMRQQATFVGWDFTSVWEIKENVSHPTLIWAKEPVFINNCTELQAIKDKDMRGKYILAADIDCAGRTFIPIGVVNAAGAGQAFAGTFDGAGHTIKGLNITYAAEYYEGFFASIKFPAVIKNLVLESPRVTSNTFYTGILVGHSNGGVIDQVVH